MRKWGRGELTREGWGSDREGGDEGGGGNEGPT